MSLGSRQKTFFTGRLAVRANPPPLLLTVSPTEKYFFITSLFVYFYATVVLWQSRSDKLN